MNLQEFFAQYPKAAVAFSGGVDSAYLLYAAQTYGRDIRAYYVKSEFQPQFELRDARRLAAQLGADLRVLALEVLSDPRIAANPPDRCYHCKNRIFSAIARAAEEDGYAVLLDGTNASDDSADRPGMRALAERGVLSPLRLCGLTKAQVRQRSQEAGLFTWDKPAYACLATRVAAGETITRDKLAATEQAEAFLSSLGFSDFRIRTQGGQARLQLPEAQFPLLLEKRREILTRLRAYYTTIALDLEARA
ncbi:MAG TPA: ATP-dependent sacrificial sulfur transferase LarE [Candidatus Butyricicoccus stercorigallinarum]|nr:ATP-dependent sacrificial sulfur transferase LarE [Candidatus Butyricicoccus stercorigallinarum]